MFERFSHEAREVVVGSQRVASDEASATVDPLHLLTSLARNTGVLTALGCPLDELADDLRRVRRRGGMSDAEVQALSGFGIEGEHILLALTSLPGVASDVLVQRGIDYLAVRRLLERRQAGPETEIAGALVGRPMLQGGHRRRTSSAPAIRPAPR